MSRLKGASDVLVNHILYMRWCNDDTAINSLVLALLGRT